MTTSRISSSLHRHLCYSAKYQKLSADILGILDRINSILDLLNNL